MACGSTLDCCVRKESSPKIGAELVTVAVERRRRRRRKTTVGSISETCADPVQLSERLRKMGFLSNTERRRNSLAAFFKIRSIIL